VAAERRYPDHHRFTAAEVDEALAAAAAAGCARVVTTEKDAVRLDPARAGDPRLAVLLIEAEVVAGEEVLEAALDAALEAGGRRLAAARPGARA
jgi:tetraacyldisaccharide 4'-kinase